MRPKSTLYDLVDIFLMDIENASELHPANTRSSIFRICPADYPNLERVELRSPNAFTAVERTIAEFIQFVLFWCAPRQIRERVVVNAVWAVSDNVSLWSRANKRSQNEVGDFVFFQFTFVAKDDCPIAVPYKLFYWVWIVRFFTKSHIACFHRKDVALFIHKIIGVFWERFHLYLLTKRNASFITGIPDTHVVFGGESKSVSFKFI